ncbi:unnamed protein product [Candidula unifasciata]|uniref:C2H2-type domain-containing protein n=1 Tax=Candidula unifasciata TaxID=100452 RepID=A0A8S3ZIJ7_9EUPU|nr:unnamed protein product [Candidula unifasciata]
MEQTITVMTEEEASDPGPNDIVIHLINPYKCGVCDVEFVDKPVFKDHMFAHLEHTKHEHPSSQIVMCITLTPETPGGMTVTRDILNLGEDGSIKQVWQPANASMNQASPLRELEEAGLIKLDHPKFELVVPKPEPLPKARSIIGSFNSAKMVAHQGQPVELLTAGVIPLEETEEVAGLLKEEVENVETDLSHIVDNRNGSYSFAFKGPNNEFQHIQIVGQEGIKGDLMMELTSIQDRRRTSRSSSNKSNECDICGKILSSSTNLLRHKMYHSAERPFRCDICDKGFKDVSNLKKHTMIHKRIFPCHLCKKSFLRKSLLALHLLRHESHTAVVKTGNSMKEITLRTFVDDDGTRVEEMSMAALNGQTFEYKHRIVKADPATDKSLKDDSLTDEKEHEVLDAGVSAEAVSVSSGNADIKGGVQRPMFTVTMGGLQVASLDQGTSTDDAQNVSLGSKGAGNPDGLDADDLPELKILPVPEEFVKMYQCGHCGKRTVQRGNMMRHLIHHLKEKPFGCDECPKQFVDKGELVKHKKTHTKPYRCPQCNGAFAHNVQLMKHIQSECLGNLEQLNYTVMEDGKTYKCDICCIEMKRLGNMIKHVGTHGASSRRSSWSRKAMLSPKKKVSLQVPYYYDSVHKAFFCGFCSKSYSQKANVHRHVRMHTKDRPHRCMHCDRWFPCASTLKRHIQMHTKPFKCEKCSCAFSRKFFLEAHMKNHSEKERLEDNPDYALLEDKSGYFCKHCDKMLSERYRMMNHVKLHLTKRLFECPTCNKCFSCRYLLLKHKKTHNKPHVCVVCGEAFTRKFFLMLHRKKMHNFQKNIPEMKDEPVEDKTESDESFFCSICGAPFARLVIKINHEKKCGEESKVMVRLPDGKGYKCKVCNKVATLKHNLMVHIRKHDVTDVDSNEHNDQHDIKYIQEETAKEEKSSGQQQVSALVKSEEPSAKQIKIESSPENQASTPANTPVAALRAAKATREDSTSLGTTPLGSSRRPARTQKVPARFLE